MVSFYVHSALGSEDDFFDSLKIHILVITFIYGTFDLQKHFVVTCLFTILLLQLMNDMHNIFAGMFYYYFDFDATHNTYDFTDEEFYIFFFHSLVRSYCHSRMALVGLVFDPRTIEFESECIRFQLESFNFS